MDKVIKGQWLEALRSGRYKQGSGQLNCGDDHFCCLGVLCDISGLGVWNDTLYVIDSSYTASNSAFEYLPSSLADKLGVSEGEQNYLSNMNDQGKSFEDIADYIEHAL